MTIIVKKIHSADVGYGDHASYIRYPAQYGVFKNGKKVGFIYSEKSTYRSRPGWWELVYVSGRTIRRFYTSPRLGSAFKQAKEFALRYKW